MEEQKAVTCRACGWEQNNIRCCWKCGKDPVTGEAVDVVAALEERLRFGCGVPAAREFARVLLQINQRRKNREAVIKRATHGTVHCSDGTSYEVPARAEVQVDDAAVFGDAAALLCVGEDVSAWDDGYAMACQVHGFECVDVDDTDTEAAFGLPLVAGGQGRTGEDLVKLTTGWLLQMGWWLALVFVGGAFAGVMWGAVQ